MRALLGCRRTWLIWRANRLRAVARRMVRRALDGARRRRERAEALERQAQDLGRRG